MPSVERATAATMASVMVQPHVDSFASMRCRMDVEQILNSKEPALLQTCRSCHDSTLEVLPKELDGSCCETSTYSRLAKTSPALTNELRSSQLAKCTAKGGKAESTCPMVYLSSDLTGSPAPVHTLASTQTVTMSGKTQPIWSDMAMSHT